MYFLIIG